MTEKLEAFDTSVIFSESDSNRTCNPLLGTQMLYLNPVSYTHLTLTTNKEV